MNINKELPGVKKNVLLKNYTTFKIGGRTRYFFVARTKEDLISAIKTTKKFNLPFFILGKGSNLLVFDDGFNGLVIKIENCKLKIENSKITAGAGLSLSKLVNISLEKGLTGSEWAVGIPGTAGGAIYGNAGAFGKSMADIIKEVEVFDINDSKFKIYNLRDCKFGYRDSIFKHRKNLIILLAVLKLRKSEKKQIQKKIKEFLNYKKRTQPLNFSSAGSIFKNSKKFSAAELIEKCNLKGKKIGNAKISEKHANFIVNLGNGKAKDVIKLINLIKKKVKNKFSIELKEEVCFLSKNF